MHSWISSSGSLETAPVTRLRTVPARLVHVQVLQMPMRQPWARPLAGALELLEQRSARR